jgi:hypothetical protein
MQRPIRGSWTDMSDKKTANRKVARQTGEQMDAGVQADHGASGSREPVLHVREFDVERSPEAPWRE